MDVKSRMKAAIEIKSKKLNGTAFRQIVSPNGVHKVQYSCRVYSDGCGSTVHVKHVAINMGIDHAYVPPHQQSLNEAEKLADRMFESARTLVFHSKAPDWSFGLALQYSIYVDIRSSTTDSRDFKTLYEIACVLVPDISRLHRFWTKCHHVVPKSKRKALAKKGLHNLRAEPGRFVGFQSLFSHTYAVILDGPTRPLVHSVNVTFDDANYTNSKERDVPASNTQFEFGAAPPEEARFDEPRFDECQVDEPRFDECQEFPPDEDS